MEKFDDYQQLIQEFAIYPDAFSGSKNELMYLALGLAGEAGEVAEKIKKYYRDGVLMPSDLVKELGDVMWYLSQMATAINTPLWHVANTNIQKLASRKQRDVLGGNGDDR